MLNKILQSAIFHNFYCNGFNQKNLPKHFIHIAIAPPTEIDGSTTECDPP